MSKTYLIQLYPVEKFIFRQADKTADGKSNYYRRSSRFPQQTALLGMLRYEILKHADESVFKNNRIQDDQKSSALIGKESFSAELGQSFGLINSLSPVFLHDTDAEGLLPIGICYQEDNVGMTQMLQVDSSKSLPKLYLKDNIQTVFSPKKALQSMYKASDGRTCCEDDFFASEDRVGIIKQYKARNLEGDNRDNEKSYHLQQFLHFREKKYSFAVFVHADGELNFPESSQVHLGAERQAFVMSAREVNQDFQQMTSEIIERDVALKEEDLYKVLLLSDAHIEPFALNDVYLSISNTIDFANIRSKTSVETQYYKQSKTKGSNQPYMGQQIELYSRGSVFYFKEKAEAESFVNCLLESSYHKIGYNYCVMITPKQEK